MAFDKCGKNKMTIEEVFITNKLKELKFKDFIRINGIRDSREVTLHFNVRKRIAKFILNLMKSKQEIREKIENE